MKQRLSWLVIGLSLMAFVGCSQSEPPTTTESSTTSESRGSDQTPVPMLTEIQGLVVHAVTRAPMPQVPIKAVLLDADPNLPPPAAVTGTTDGEGRFSLLGILADRRYSVSGNSETIVVGSTEVHTGTETVTALTTPLPAMRDFGFRGLLLLDPTAERSVAEIPRRPNNRLTYLRELVPTITPDRIEADMSFATPQTLKFYYCRSRATAEDITALRPAVAVSQTDSKITVSLGEEQIPVVSSTVIGQGQKGEVVLLEAKVPALTAPTYFGTQTTGRYNLVYLFQLDPVVK